MEYKDGTVFELGDNNQKFIVVSTVNANSVDYDAEGDFLVVAPMEGTIEDPIIHNSNPVIMQPSGQGMRIILDEHIIKNVLLNM